MRNDLFEKYREVAPNLEEVLNLLGGQISTEEMAQMSYEVDVNGRDTAEVAREFLISKRFLEA